MEGLDHTSSIGGVRMFFVALFHTLFISQLTKDNLYRNQLTNMCLFSNLNLNV